MFIVLEGVDGVGKTTQAKLLADRLRQEGMPVMVWHDPGSTMLGEAIRDLLLRGNRKGMNFKSETLLFMASRASLPIAESLEAGWVVIMDRYYPSTWVYQRLGVDEPFDALIDWSCVKPDLMLVIDSKNHKTVVTMDNFESVGEEREMFRNRYREFCDLFGGILMSGEGTILGVHNDIWNRVQLRFAELERAGSEFCAT